MSVGTYPFLFHSYSYQRQGVQRLFPTVAYFAVPRSMALLGVGKGTYKCSMTQLNMIGSVLGAECIHILSRADLTTFRLFCCLTVTISSIFAMRSSCTALVPCASEVSHIVANASL